MYQRITEFDLWREGYAGLEVSIYVSGTTTLASVFTDTGLTQAAANPQTLESTTFGDRSFGKFSQSLYVGTAYYLDIEGRGSTGVQQVPLYNLRGVEASHAQVIATGRSVARTLRDQAADVIHASQFGQLKTEGSSATANTSIIANAIGAAAANGGGYVLLPPGTFPCTTFTLSGGVILKGAGRDVTVVTSEQAADVVTIGGDGAGFEDLTIDGVSVQAGSVGVKLIGKDRTIFNRVTVKRFETNIFAKGGQHNTWRDLYSEGATNGAFLHGDADSGDTGNGKEWSHNFWSGRVKQCTAFGIQMSYEDRKVEFNSLTVEFDSNTGDALELNGCQQTALPECWWDGNTVTLDVHDDTDADANPDNQTIGLRVTNSRLNGGTMTLNDRCQDVIFEGCAIKDVDITLTGTEHFIQFRDTTEDAQVTIAGAATKLGRFNRENRGKSIGTTTDAITTEAWSTTLAPGEVIAATFAIAAIQTNDVASAIYHYHGGARRPGSTLDYDAQTANFTAGEVVTGGTSGATAVIQNDSDSGSTGTLTLIDIDGEFQNNETITDPLGGSATVNGTLTHQDAVLMTSSPITGIEVVAAWNVNFQVSGGDFRVVVVGAASDNVEWHVDVIATRTEG